MPHSWMCYTPSLDIFKVGWHLEQSSLLDGVPAHSRVVRSEWSLRSLPTHSLILWLSNHPSTVNNCKTGKGASSTTAQRSVSQQMNLANGISHIIHRRPTSFCYRSSWSSLLLFLILKATYSTIVVQETWRESFPSDHDKVNQWVRTWDERQTVLKAGWLCCS